MIPLIALEEHFSWEGAHQLEAYRETYKSVTTILNQAPELLAKLRELGPGRLEEMDKGKVCVQVLSHPGLACSGPEVSIAANNQLARAVKDHPDRFAGFAVLPMAQPQAAAEELKRCVKDLEFVGALVDNHVNGVFYDAEKFWCVFETAQELDVPIYLHPVWPDDQIRSRYEGNYSPQAAFSIGAAGFGWHVETGLHILKLFAAGVFDRFPRLKIIIGHMGETLPFMLERIMQFSQAWGERQRDFRTVYDGNIWITTSGCWSVNPMATILRNTKVDHVLYSVDYPFAKIEKGLAFMEELEKSGLVNEEEFRMIGYKNAERLLKIKAQG